MTRILASSLSLLVPGLGQALRGRGRDALLFLWVAAWFHAMTLGALVAVYPQVEDLGLTLALGAFGVPRGLAVPEAVVFTALVATLHIWAARDAWGPPRNNHTSWPADPPRWERR